MMMMIISRLDIVGCGRSLQDDDDDDDNNPFGQHGLWTPSSRV
jgi:hypothetical protein